MRRRAFLGAVVGAGATLWPGWARRALADTSVGAPGGGTLGTAAARARGAGKPLLVLVIPDGDEAKWTRGRQFGALLNHGSDDEIAPLALAEVECATAAALRPLVKLDGEPLMVLVEPALGKAFPVDGRLPVARPGFDARAYAEEEAVVDRQIVALAKLVRGALWADDRMARRRAAEARAALSPAEVAAIEPLLSVRGRVPLVAVDRAAALVAEHGAKYQGRLAEAARARLRDRRVPGSHWATDAGCATEVEGIPDDEQSMVACGMGHVPRKSQRFLYFWSMTPRQRSRG